MTSPSDAIGETMDVTGTIVLDAEGNVVSEEIADSCRTGRSDQRLVPARQLRQAKYPADGPVSQCYVRVERDSGTALAAADVRRSDGADGGRLHDPRADQRGDLGDGHSGRSGESTGTAKTTITFEQFGLTQPRVAVVLSVTDEIRLEIDFTVVREEGQ